MDEGSCRPDILQKYRNFADDYNSGLDRATLCRKYKIHEEKFPSYLEFLKKKGLHLTAPAQFSPGGSPKEAAGKNVPATKRFGLFDRIENREGALKVVRDAAKCFYLLGAIQILLGLFIMKETLVDGIAFAILAFFLQKFASRIAAVLLLLISGASLIVTILNLAGITSLGGKNLWLAAIVVILSVRAVEATFRLKGEFRNSARMPLTGYFRQHEELAFVVKALATAFGIIFIKNYFSGLISYLLPAFPVLFLIGIRMRAAATGADPMDLLREHLTFLPLMRSESERRSEIKPWVTYALILVNVIVFYCFESYVSPAFISDNLVFLPSRPDCFNGPLSAFTAMYLHASSGHLWGNMTFLWVVGSAIERRVGRLKFFSLYHLTGVIGGLVFILVEYLFHGSMGHSLGASGAIAGIMGIFAVRCYFKSMIFPLPILGIFSLILPLSLKIRLNSLVIVALFFLSDLAGGLGQIILNSGSTVGHWVHLGGMISGMLIAGFLKLNRDAVAERHLETGIRASVSSTGYEEGERSLKYALERSPENIDALVGMARLKSRSQATPEGKALYERAIGRLLVEHPAEVVEVYREYVEKYHTIHPDLSVTTGLVEALLKAGETGLLIHTLERLVEVPGLPAQVREKSLYQLATLLEFSNCSEAANRCYARFAVEYPSSLLAERAREKGGFEVSPQGAHPSPHIPEPPQQTFRLVFNGLIASGSDEKQTKEKLATLFRCSGEQIEGLFSGRPVVIKKGVDHETAQRMKAAFDRTGASCQVETEDLLASAVVPEAPLPQAPPEVVAPTSDQPVFSCPKCGHRQEKGEMCGKCGVYFAKVAGVAEREFHTFRDHLPGGAAKPAISQVEERRWAMFCHLIGLSGMLIPFGNIFGPLAIWFWKRDRSEFIYHHGKTALNMQITFTLLIFTAPALAFLIHLPMYDIWLLSGIIGTFVIIMITLAALRAHRGNYLSFPWCGEFVK